MLAVENCLVRCLPEILTWRVIVEMDDDMLRKVALEPSHVIKDRERNAGKLATLQQVLRICSRHALHSGMSCVLDG